MFHDIAHTGRWRLHRQAITALFMADWMCHTLARLWQQRWQANRPTVA